MYCGRLQKDAKVQLQLFAPGGLSKAPAEKSGMLIRLVAEKMLCPRLDYEEFEELKLSELEDYGEESYLSKLMKTDYQRQLSASLDSLMGNLTYGRRLKTTKADIKHLSLDRMAGFYKTLYSNPE